MYYLKTEEKSGRGLYAAFNGIKNGAIITECEILVLNERDTVLVNATELQYYTFAYNKVQDCLVLGDGEIFNHADFPNVGYRLIDFDNRKLMQFYALQDIKHNEQLYTDYSQDIKVEIEKYIKNPSLFLKGS